MFRVYVEKYLTSLPVVNTDLDLIISQLQSTEYGVPIQIYFFSRNKIWKEYERIQSDIFDHFFAMIPKFELRFTNIRSKDNEKTDFIAKFVKIPIGPNRNTWALKIDFSTGVIFLFGNRLYLKK